MNFDGDDFKLKSGSVLIDAGVDLPADGNLTNFSVVNGEGLGVGGWDR